MIEPNWMGLGMIVTFGNIPVPVKLDEAVAALLRIFSPPDSKPLTLGVKATEIRQNAAGARICPSVQSEPPGETRAKSAGFDPPVKE